MAESQTTVAGAQRLNQSRDTLRVPQKGKVGKLVKAFEEIHGTQQGQPSRQTSVLFILFFFLNSSPLQPTGLGHNKTEHSFVNSKPVKYTIANVITVCKEKKD